MGSLSEVLATKAKMQAYELEARNSRKLAQDAEDAALALAASSDTEITVATSEQVRNALTPLVDEMFVLSERMKAAEALLDTRQRVIVLQHGVNGVTRYLGVEPHHAKFGDILRRVYANVPVMLIGPTQCGKTHICSQVAKALHLEFSANSMSAGCSESDLFGWLLPTGAAGTFEYQPAPLVTRVLEGGLSLVDEVDAADANLLLAINMLVANRRLFIPRRLHGQDVQAHANWRLMAAANTAGDGANALYPARNQLDAATLARFVKVEMDYDPVLEYQLYDQELVAIAHVLRANVERARLRRVVTSATIKNWTALKAVGVPMEELVTDFMIGWSKEEKSIAMEKSSSATEAAQQSAEARARAVIATRKAAELAASRKAESAAKGFEAAFSAEEFGFNLNDLMSGKAY